MLDMRTETEDKDTKTDWGGGKNRITGGQTDSESTMKSGTMADADIPLGNGTICLCLAPVYHIGSEIEKRKNAQARPENEKSSTRPPNAPPPPLLPKILCFWQHNDANAKNPPLVHHVSNRQCSKALRQPDASAHQSGSVWRVPDIDGCTSIQEATAGGALANGYDALVEVKDIQRFL